MAVSWMEGMGWGFLSRAGAVRNLRKGMGLRMRIPGGRGEGAG